MVKQRQYYSNCIPGESKQLDDGTTYTVSPNGNWIRHNTKTSKKAEHKAKVKAKKESKELDKKSKALDKKMNENIQNLLATGEIK